jgi:hypothetical protein
MVQLLCYQTHINHALCGLAQSMRPAKPRDEGGIQQNSRLNLNFVLTIGLNTFLPLEF